VDVAQLGRGVGHDISKGEIVEAEIDAFISKRHDRRVVEEGHTASEEMYEESARRYQERMRVRARYEWHLFHTAQAERRGPDEVILRFAHPRSCGDPADKTSCRGRCFALEAALDAQLEEAK
jgi:hypothetical protein